MQPDFTRRLTLHRCADGSWHAQLWTNVSISAAGEITAKRGRELQLQLPPGQQDVGFPSQASSPCGEFFLLNSDSDSPLWLAHSVGAVGSPGLVSLPEPQSGGMEYLSWLPGPGPARLLAAVRGVHDPDTSDSQESSPGRCHESLHIRVLTPTGAVMSECKELHLGGRTPPGRLCTASPNRAHVAVTTARGLTVLALADCSKALELRWPWSVQSSDEGIDKDTRLNPQLEWSPDAFCIYASSSRHEMHAVCCLQSQSWQDVTTPLSGRGTSWQPIAGWGAQGMLAMHMCPGGDAAQPMQLVPVAAVPGSQLWDTWAVARSSGASMSFPGRVSSATFSPDYTWVALTMQTGASAWQSGSFSNTSVLVARCSTGAVAAECVVDCSCGGVSLQWASAGNRLLCQVDYPCQTVLLAFEG